MKLHEEKELKKITDEFTKGVELFTKKECKKALEIFDDIIEKYKDTEYYSIAEVQARSKVYKTICESRLNPVTLKLESDEDFLNQGILNLNSGNYDEALKLFLELEEKGYKDPYLTYLLSILYLKKEDEGKSLKYLKKCIKKDDYYKVIAYNEPDFSEIFDKEEFQKTVSLS